MSAATVTIHSVAELKKWMPTFVSALGPRALILLTGDLGAGKTEFVRALVAELGQGANVMSPTFAIHNQYLEGLIDHFDLYRLEDQDDLESTGFWDVLAKPTGYVVVEWADRVSDKVWPAHWPCRRVRIVKQGESERLLEIRG